MKKQNFFMKVLYLLLFSLSMSGAVFGQAPNVTASSYALGATNVTYTFTYKTTQVIPADQQFFYMNFPCGFNIPNPAPGPSQMPNYPWGYSGTPTSGVLSYPSGWNYYPWYPYNITVKINGVTLTEGFLPLGSNWSEGVQINRHYETPAGSNVEVTVTTHMLLMHFLKH